MTPQEISDFKQSWMSKTPYTYSTMAYWTATYFCKNNFEPKNYHRQRHSNPDDSHKFFFFKFEDYREFVDFFEGFEFEH